MGLPEHRHTPSFLWQQAEAIRGIDPQLHRLGVGCPEIAAFIELYFQEQRGQTETDVNLLARQLAQAYSQIHQAGKICLQVIGEIINDSPDLSNHMATIPELAQLMHKSSEKADASIKLSRWSHASNPQ